MWREEHLRAFNVLKEALTKPPILALPTLGDPFILDVDASNLAIGAELIQVQGGGRKK